MPNPGTTHFVIGSLESLERSLKFWRNMMLRFQFVPASNPAGGGSMDIPDELNKLMAELKRVTTKDSETVPLDRRPSATDIDQFLSQYGFGEDVVMERIEITEQGVFQFYLFAAWQPETEELSLFQMPERSDRT
jgi:hypothetical protein